MGRSKELKRLAKKARRQEQKNREFALRYGGSVTYHVRRKPLIHMILFKLYYHEVTRIELAGTYG